MIFQPKLDAQQTPAAQALKFSDEWIATPDAGGVAGSKLHGWWLPGDTEDAPALLYLHGNADTISTNVKAIGNLRQAGFAVLAIDYRGFGRSANVLPEERSAYADAAAAWQRLAELAPRARKHLAYGHSLGGAIAVELGAKAQGMDALVVEGSFTSVADVAQSTSYSWMPMSLVLTQRFASDQKVGQLHMPKLFIHCRGDKVIPVRFGEHLYQKAAEPKTQLLISGGNHNQCPAAASAAWLTDMRRIGGLAATSMLSQRLAPH